MEDTRSDARKRYSQRLLDKELFKRLELNSLTPLIKIAGCLIFAIVIFQLPPGHGATAGGGVATVGSESAAAGLTSPAIPLTETGRWTLFILVFAAGLWATEAIPAFAVALVVIGMQIAIIGKPWSLSAGGKNDWEVFAGTLGNPLIWLFFGGFVLASAAEKTGLNRAIASEVIRRLGTRPGPLLAGSMGVTFVFSMFISNTAAATMMLAVMLPVVGSLGPEDRFRKAMVLGIAFAANLGGMGTVIGSPPNAIAAGALAGVQPVDFFRWIVAAAPPATLMIILTWAYLMLRYRPAVRELDLAAFADATAPHRLPVWRRYLVVLVFGVTVLLWLTTSLHGVPSTVVAFVPICVLCACGVIDGDDICEIRWDVLLLIAGGLSLGLGVTQSGLANWLVGLLPMDRFASLAVVVLLAYATMALSNVMSNTAAANILVPIGLVVGAGSEAATVIPLAIGASAAMCLPISTPPNAIAYGTGQVNSKDMIQGGIWIGLLTPLLAALWCQVVF
jgi:sodium-dependent dicarboxylate transporter 2/3/5